MNVEDTDGPSDKDSRLPDAPGPVRQDMAGDAGSVKSGKPATEPEALSNPENMEVHYEPHFKHSQHKKHLKEYFKEFLMIFFAVFLGFLAENLREYIAEKSREKEYVRGFIGDLKSDSLNLDRIAKFYGKTLPKLDTLCKMIAQDQSDLKSREKLYTAISEYLGYAHTFSTNNITLQQARSSGDLRYLKRSVAENISNYYYQVDSGNWTKDKVETLYANVWATLRNSFDFNILDSEKPLEPGVVIPSFGPNFNSMQLVNDIRLYQRYTRRYNNRMISPLISRNKNLLKLLRTTYHLKDE